MRRFHPVVRWSSFSCPDDSKSPQNGEGDSDNGTNDGGELQSAASQEPNPLLDASPFRERLGTNYVPTDADVTEIRALVQEKQVEIDLIAQEMKRLEEQLALLAKKQTPALDFINKHNAILEPIRRLPNEVLQEIFCHCLSTDSLSSMHKDDFPMVLTRVCSPWRRLAFETPRLWANLHIAVPCATYNSYSQDPTPTTTPFIHQVVQSRILGIQEWIRRSGTVPLSLCVVQWGSAVTVADEKLMKEVFDVLRPHARRWRDLDFVMPLPCLRPFIEVPAEELVALRSLKLNITFPGTESIDADDHPPPLGIVAPPAAPATATGTTSPATPALGTTGASTTTDVEKPPPRSHLSDSGFFRSASLTELTFTFPHEDYLSYQINWSQLTRLVVEGGSHHLIAESYFHILSEASQLEYLRLETGWTIEGGETPTETWSSIITLPNLKKLAICERSSFPALGKSIRCPVLEELEYHDAPPYPGDFDHDDQDQDDDQLTNSTLLPRNPAPDASLAAILSHSGSFIKTLTINPHIYSLQQLLRYLRCCPLLETLMMVEVYAHPTLIQGAVNGEVLKAFVTPDPLYGGDVLCPRLSTLICDRNATFTQRELLAFLRIKQGAEVPDDPEMALPEGVCKMQRLVVQFAMPEEEGIYEEVRRLVPGERKVYFSYGPGKPFFSVRDGLFRAANSWHSYYEEAYPFD